MIQACLGSMNFYILTWSVVELDILNISKQISSNQEHSWSLYQYNVNPRARAAVKKAAIFTIGFCQQIKKWKVKGMKRYI